MPDGVDDADSGAVEDTNNHQSRAQAMSLDEAAAVTVTPTIRSSADCANTYSPPQLERVRLLERTTRASWVQQDDLVQPDRWAGQNRLLS